MDSCRDNPDNVRGALKALELERVDLVEQEVRVIISAKVICDYVSEAAGFLNILVLREPLVFCLKARPRFENLRLAS